MTTFRRGDVVLVVFPHSDRIHYKKRPALVVQDETVDTKLGQRIVVGITTNLARTGQTRVPVRKDSADGRSMGLLGDSIIMADSIQTIQPFMIDRPIGRCPAMGRVGNALKCALGLRRDMPGTLVRT